MTDHPEAPNNPAKDTRFKPGRSGNPKGRPRKVPQAQIPSQQGRDVRAIARIKIPVKTPGGVKKMTLDQAIYYRIFIDAANGKISQQRQAIKLIQDAFGDNIIQDSRLRLIDQHASDYQDVGSKDPLIRAFMISLAERSKR